jgi:hypothetical protein
MATTQWMRVPMNCYFDIVDMYFEAIKYTYTYILMTVFQLPDISFIRTRNHFLLSLSTER